MTTSGRKDPEDLYSVAPWCRVMYGNLPAAFMTALSLFKALQLTFSV
jgi:hypothetical protein